MSKPKEKVGKKAKRGVVDGHGCRKKPDSLCKCLTIACAIFCLSSKRQEETIDDQQEWTEGQLWDADKERICDYCGINMDNPWLDILKFFHEDCWKQYRKDGKIYPMPKCA